MTCEAKDLADPNEPLCWVVLVPFDGVSVVHGELVVKVVVSLADCDEGGNEVVARCVLVVKRSLPEPVSE